MHHAPSVSYPVGRSSWAGSILATLWLLGALAIAGLCWQLAGFGWRTGLAWIACLVAGGWAMCLWQASPVGELQWDGTHWHWHAAHAAATAGSVRVALDWQDLLLLSFRPLADASGSPDWLWLERATASADWPALRRAVYSRANPDGLPDAEPPAATP